MSISIAHNTLTSTNDSAAQRPAGQILFDLGTGYAYRYVQFKDAVTYVAGHSCSYAAVGLTAVTNDRAGGSSLGDIPAGIAIAVMTQNYYGWMLVSGRYSTLVTSGADDIAVGESLILHATTDGACDGVVATATTTSSFGIALAADVDADNTVDGLIRLL